MVVLVGVGKGGLRAPYVPLEMTLSAFLVVRVAHSPRLSVLLSPACSALLVDTSRL